MQWHKVRLRALPIALFSLSTFGLSTFSLSTLGLSTISPLGGLARSARLPADPSNSPPFGFIRSLDFGFSGAVAAGRFRDLAGFLGSFGNGTYVLAGPSLPTYVRHGARKELE